MGAGAAEHPAATGLEPLPRGWIELAVRRQRPAAACFGPILCRHSLRGLPNSLEGASLGRGWTIVGTSTPWGGGGSGTSLSARVARRCEGNAFGQPPRVDGWALWMAGLWLCYLPSIGRQPVGRGRCIAEAVDAGFSSWDRRRLAPVPFTGCGCARRLRVLGNREGESGLPPRGCPGPQCPVPCAGARPSGRPRRC